MNSEVNTLDPSAIAAEKIRAVIESLPKDVWNTTTAPTFFKISKNVASLVPENYQGQEGELVFCYRNDDGFISFTKIYPIESTK
jgi:hypothetical protein